MELLTTRFDSEDILEELEIVQTSVFICTWTSYDNDVDSLVARFHEHDSRNTIARSFERNC